MSDEKCRVCNAKNVPEEKTLTLEQRAYVAGVVHGTGQCLTANLVPACVEHAALIEQACSVPDGVTCGDPRCNCVICRIPKVDMGETDGRRMSIFELAVVVGAVMIMNGINGQNVVLCARHHHMITSIVGVRMSDMAGAHGEAN